MFQKTPESAGQEHEPAVREGLEQLGSVDTLVDVGWPRQLSVPCARHLGDDPRHRLVTSSSESRLEVWHT